MVIQTPTREKIENSKVKESKQIYFDIEYQVFILEENELHTPEFVKQIITPLLHHPRFRNCIVKKLKDGKVYRVTVLTNGKIHNEYGPAVVGYLYKAWWLNGKRYHWGGLLTSKLRDIQEGEYKNELRKLRLDSILQ